ncbi:MAG TPA: sigma-70 family RNA polymerase sigma factor [Candidatus Hydrogenedentes bacterium]|nr:sigma-70 family RNA polymerase sigma factor [Candidatus Hydrogenedentota bacterium]
MFRTYMPPDEWVVRQVLSGQRNRFQILVNRHLPTVYAVAYAQTHNHADAEDIAQEAFLKAFTSLDALREPRRFGRWIVTIARNTAWALGNKRKRESEVVELLRNVPDPMPADVAEKELQSLLRQRIERLEPDHREVLILHYFAGKSTGEIADLLGISRSAAKKRLERARVSLSRDVLSAMQETIRPARPLKEQSKKILALILSASVAWEMTNAAVAGTAGIVSLITGFMAHPAAALGSAAGILLLLLAGWGLLGQAPPEAEAKVQPEQQPAHMSKVEKNEIKPSPAQPQDSSTETTPVTTPNANQLNESSGLIAKLKDAVMAGSDPNTALAENLQNPVSIKFENIHVSDILEFMSDSYDLNIIVDQRVVAWPGEGYAQERPYVVTDGIVDSLKVKNLPIKEVLMQLCQSLDLAFEMMPGYIWISSPELIQADGALWTPEPPSLYKEEMEKTLKLPACLEFPEIHLSEITEFIADTYDMNIVLDYRAIEPPQCKNQLPSLSLAPFKSEKIDMNTGADLHVRNYIEKEDQSGTLPRGYDVVTDGMVPYLSMMNVRLKDALEAMLRPLNLTYSLEDGIVWITSPEKLFRERFIRPAMANADPHVVERLNEPMKFVFEKISLVSILECIEQRNALPIFVDRRVMTTEKPRVHSVDFTVSQVYIALNVLTRLCNMEYVVDNDRIVVSTPDRLITRTFPQDQIVPVSSMKNVAPHEPANTQPNPVPVRNGDAMGKEERQVVYRMFQEPRKGVVRAQIQTGPTTRWYSTGEQFEKYRIMSITPSLCTLLDESTNETLSLEYTPKE